MILKSGVTRERVALYTFDMRTHTQTPWRQNKKELRETIYRKDGGNMRGKHAGIRVDRVPGKWPAQNGADANLNIHPSTCYVFLMCTTAILFFLLSLVVRESRGDAWKLSITFFLVVGGGSRGGVTPCQQVRAPTHTRKTVFP